MPTEGRRGRGIREETTNERTTSQEWNSPRESRKLEDPEPGGGTRARGFVNNPVKCLSGIWEMKLLVLWPRGRRSHSQRLCQPFAALCGEITSRPAAKRLPSGALEVGNQFASNNHRLSLLLHGGEKRICGLNTCKAYLISSNIQGTAFACGSGGAQLCSSDKWPPQPLIISTKGH